MLRHYIRDIRHITDIDAIVRLWLLRILVPLGAHRNFVAPQSFADDGVAASIGLEHWIEQPDNSFDAGAVLSELRQLHRTAEQQSAKAVLPTRLRGNVQKLSGLMRLDKADSQILEFTVTLHSERVLDDAADLLGGLSSIKVFRTLSIILDLPESVVRSALDENSVLARTGLVSVDHRGTGVLRTKLKLLSDTFADLMVSSEANPIALLRGMVSAVGPGRLQLSNYRHIQLALDILCPYLRHAMASGQRGVNVYMHGAPGTGKTQLARALASTLGVELFEVASEAVDGELASGEQRLRAYRAAQSFFSQRRAMLVFDEAEDVFSHGDGPFGRKSTAQLRKAWINNMLEDNPVPTLWLSNSIGGLDPAFIRRFDLVFEVPVPPRQQRQRILHENCADLLDADTLSRVADIETLAPAIVTRAGSVVRSIRDQLGSVNTGAAFEYLISNTLAAQGHQPLPSHDPARQSGPYDLDFIHADADLSVVAEGLIAARAGRLCLYGPAGTGKTAYGRWLAQQLDAPLLVKRASDLMSMWVGENEKNIAGAFRQAETEGAILLIDEIDTFLMDRRDARLGWETRLVNEVLTQTESFSGVFIATTNLMQGLDQAALRRFDLKVKFDFLRGDQAWKLLCRVCEVLFLAPPMAAEQARIARLHQLTPGDFTVVLRQHRFRPLKSAAALLSALEAECAMKEGVRQSMGFL